jgi:sterol desaturase/sphingolipid hydroxylase (fatty acid hydroxylase superfamily)
MKYVTRVLQPGETVEYVTSLHWLVYVRAVLLLLVALIALIGSAMVGNFDWGLVTSDQLALALQIVALIFAIFAFFSWLRAVINRATTELAVTDRRVITRPD